MPAKQVKSDSRLLERALAAIQSGVMVTDALMPDDPIVYVNRAFEEITGYSSEEAIGCNPRFLQAGDSDQPTLDDLRKIRRVHNDDVEWAGVLRNYKKDGALFYNELSAAAVRDEGGRATHHIYFMTDVSERLEAEGRLRFQARLLDAVGQVVVAVDVSGRVAYCNRAAERLYGWSAEEAVGRPADEVMVAEDQMERAGEIWSELIVGRSWSGEFVVRRRDGTAFPAAVTDTPVFDERGVLVGVIGVSMDVTESKEAENALRESERRFKQLFENSADALFVIHPETREIADCNREACRSLGYPRAELLALCLEDVALEVLSEEEKRRRGTDTPWRRSLAGEPGTIIGFHENVHRRKDGTTFPVEVGVCSIEYAGRRMILASARDATERKRAEEALCLRDRAIAESREGILITDPTLLDNPMVYVNRGFERITGYSAEELVGRNCRMLQGADREQPALGGLRAAVGEGREWTRILRNYRKDGTPFWNELSVSPVRDGGGRVTRFVGVMNDATERREAEEALRKSNDLLRAVMEGTTDAVFVKDLEGRYLMINGAGAEDLGKTVEEVLGKTDAELFAAEDGREVMESDREIVASGEVRTIEDTKTTEEGATRTFLATKGPYTNAAGDVVGLFGVSRDITERKALERRLEHQAFHDPLTDLPNRTLVMDRLGHALARARRSGGTVAVLFMDLDNFKYVNDSLGHDAGDRLLVEAAWRLEGCVRPGDTVARLGGDEFTVLLEDAKDAGDATRVAERAVEALGEPFDLAGREVFSGISVGVASGEAGRDRPEDLLRKADLALYEAKRGGKARVAPDEFIPLAEENGLIVPVGERVLREACRQTKAWQEGHPSDPPLVVGVNLSAKQLSHLDLVGDVEGILRETGLDPQRLTLEVTESALVENAERHADALCRGSRSSGCVSP